MFELVSCWRCQNESSSCSLAVACTVERYGPCLIICLAGRSILRNSLVGYEISENLGFDGCSWYEVDIKLTELNYPFCNPADNVLVLDDFSQGKRRDNCDFVCLEVVVQFP